MYVIMCCLTSDIAVAGTIDCKDNCKQTVARQYVYYTYQMQVITLTTTT